MDPGAEQELKRFLVIRQGQHGTASTHCIVVRDSAGCDLSVTGHYILWLTDTEISIRA